ncbi:MAG TPA: OmpH family outer membrane protein [Burkholderiales bacterium]|nr:OmpH family outer membrane protein [Burkholderiales bacterium]
MKQSRFVSMIAAASMVAAAGAASAQQTAATQKVGFVNTERVMAESRASLEAQKRLEAEFAARDKEITAGPPGEVERRRQALAEDMSQKRDEALKQIVEKANAMIKRIAEEEKLDAVFLEAVYVSPRIDITEKVIKALDAAK